MLPALSRQAFSANSQLLGWSGLRLRVADWGGNGKAGALRPGSAVQLRGGSPVRHCLHCGRRQRAWVCAPCAGTDPRPWALREGLAQDVIAVALALVPVRRLVWNAHLGRHDLAWRW